MASFTDNSQALSTFNPYITQVPVDDYVAVGMEKQRKYEEGVQKTQSAIDSVASLPVVKDVQKQYLNERLGQLKSSISKVVGQDFSQSQLVNQIGGLTSQIANDPIVQSAVSSSIRYSSESAKLGQAQKEGKSSIANEYDFQDSFQKWMSDGDAKSSFTGSYTPYVDYKDKILKMIKELYPDETIQQLPFQMDANGNPIKVNGVPVFDTVMIEKQSKSLTPEKIQAAINAAMTPDVQNQMQIDGRYEYRGLNKAGLKVETDKSYQYRLDQNNDILSGLAAKKLINPSNATYQQNLDAQIADVTNHRDSLIKQYRNDVRFLDTNPEGFKGELYTQNWMSNASTGLSYAKNSFTYKDNPYAEYNLKVQKFNLDSQQFKFDMDYKRALLADKEKDRQVDIYKAELVAGKAGKGKLGDTGLSGLLGGVSTMEPIDTGALPVENQGTYSERTGEIAQAIEGKKLYAMSALFPNNMTTQFESGQTTPTLVYKTPKDKSDAEAKLAMMEDAYASGKTVPTEAREYFAANANAQKAITNQNAALADLKNTADRSVNLQEVFKGLPNLKVNVKGTEYKMSPQDIASTIKRVRDAVAGVNNYALAPGYSDTSVRKQFAAPQDAAIYDVYKALYNGQPVSQGQQAIADQIRAIDPLMAKHQAKLTERSDIVDKGLQNMLKIKQSTAFSLDAAKPEQRDRLQSVVGTLVDNYAKQTAGELPGGSDLGTIGKFYKDPTTRFQLEQTQTGSTNIVLTNPAISGPAQRIPITVQQSEQWFPGSNISQLGYIDKDLALTSNRGTPTTDIQKAGQMSAYILQNENLNHFGVKYHVEEPFHDGRYKVKLYITNKDAEVGAWKETDAQLPDLLTREGLANYLATFGDDNVSKLLGIANLPPVQP